MRESERSEHDLGAGAFALTLLALPLNVIILNSLAAGPKKQRELRREAGSPAQSTLRSRLRALEEAGTIVKHKQNAFPGALEYELEEPGRELGFVSAVLERWLEEAPHGQLALGSEQAKAATKSLIEGWSTTMLHSLATRPRSLTELARAIPTVSYPCLERRLETMRLAEQVKALAGSGQGTPHVVTGWLRRAVAPLTAATRWDHRHLPERGEAVARHEAEGFFLLAMPLLRPPDELSGACQLAIRSTDADDPQLVGVTAQVGGGRILSYAARLDPGADARVSGSVSPWLQAMIDGDDSGLERGGDTRLADGTLAGLRDVLFGERASGDSLISE